MISTNWAHKINVHNLFFTKKTAFIKQVDYLPTNRSCSGTVCTFVTPNLKCIPTREPVTSQTIPM